MSIPKSDDEWRKLLRHCTDKHLIEALRYRGWTYAKMTGPYEGGPRREWRELTKEGH